ncbi:unnamed protein product [Soboliphyme baturini]|uniref:Protein sleepless n=1 Tax=Soboliphyme baturini TaxID=241478 RepID=A0A183ITL5_9BILA|nr:unnamed protein product [Soboliphyme baturini]
MSSVPKGIFLKLQSVLLFVSHLQAAPVHRSRRHVTLRRARQSSMDGIAVRRFMFGILALCAAIHPSAVVGIDCYVCSSINRTNPYCEDTFNTNYPNINYLQTNCMAYRKGRSGFFPADHCIKINGISGEYSIKQLK